MKAILLVSALLVVGFQSASANDQVMSGPRIEESAHFGVTIGGNWGEITIGGGRPHYHLPYHPPYDDGYGAVTCYAQNGRGQYFQGYGHHPRRAMRNAIEECYRYSRYCQEAGCDYN